MLAFAFAFILFLFASVPARADNNWDEPCHHGQCSYDTPVSSGAPASLLITGPAKRLSDVTNASGWIILDCDSTVADQDIRLMCEGPNLDEAGCSHVMQEGVDGTVVRLPEGCGKGPFAVLTAWKTAENQTIPADIAQQIQAHDDGTLPMVYSATLSFDFSLASTAHGPIQFALTGSSAGGGAKVPKGRRGRVVGKRGFFDPIKSIFKHATSDVGKATSAIESIATGVVATVTSDIKSEATVVASKVQTVVSEVTSAAKSVESVITSKAKSIKSVATSVVKSAESRVKSAVTGAHTIAATKTVPLDFAVATNVLNANTDCGASGDISLTVDVGVDTDATAAFDINIAGTLAPAKITTLTLTGYLDGDFSGMINLTASALGGMYSTGQLNVFNQGIPDLGIAIEGIFDLGATFNIAVEADVTFDSELDASVGLDFHLDHSKFAFPKSAKTGDPGSTSPRDTPLRLDAAPDASLNGTITAHLIPSVQFGLNIFKLKTTATLFVTVDAAASLDLSFQAEGAGDNGVGDNGTGNDGTGGDGTADNAQSTGNQRRAATVAASACVDAYSTIVGNMGAEGSLGSLFDQTLSIPLFSKQYTLLQSKCFTDQASTPAAASRRAVTLLPGLTIPNLNLPSLSPTIPCPQRIGSNKKAKKQKFADTVIPAANIKAREGTASHTTKAVGTKETHTSKPHSVKATTTKASGAKATGTSKPHSVKATTTKAAGSKSTSHTKSESKSAKHTSSKSKSAHATSSKAKASGAKSTDSSKPKKTAAPIPWAKSTSSSSAPKSSNKVQPNRMLA